MGDFTTQFHSLSGNTVGEKRRSLLRLFQTHPNETVDLIPQNHLERIFYVDSLIFYRDFEKLYANYLKNDDITVNKLRNCPWFFRRILDMPEDFVWEILPQFSYVARQKLITGASKVMSEHEADGIFDALVDRYGLAHGMRIMTRCSKAKISKIVQNCDDIEVKKPQLKALYKTCPEIFEEIIRDKNSPVFEEIANENPDFFIKLVKNGKCSKKLGRRSTKNLMNTKKEVILDNVTFYLSNVLNIKKFVRMMGGNIEKIYEQLLPADNPNSTYSLSWDLLKCCPENKQYLLHLKVVEEKCGHFDTSFVTDSFLALVKDDDLREKLALDKYKETQSEEWWKYYKTKDCLVKVTEMLNSSSNQKKRINLAKVLAINCCNNQNRDQDYEEFLHVLELVLKRLKNDTACLTTFINRLFAPGYKTKGIDFAKLKESHWKLLTEVVSAPNYEDTNVNNFIKIHVLYMVFLNETQQTEALENLLQAFIDKFGLDLMMYHLELDAAGAGGRFERKFLISMMDKGVDWKLFKRIFEYNKRISKNPIDLFQISNLEDLLQEHFAVPFSERDNNIRDIFDSLCLDSEFRSKSQKLYWSELSELGSVESITWYLRRDFNTFSCHFDDFLEACFGQNPRLNTDSLWRKIKCYKHLVAKLLQRLNEENSPKIFRVLGRIVNFEDYVKAFQNLERFYASSVTSTDQKLREAEIEKKTFKAFRQFVRNVKTLKAKPQELLAFKNRPFVERLPMIYHAFYNIPECEALPFLDEIRVGGVSTTKQALFLTCVICDRKTVAEELKRNKLTQTVLQAVRFFMKNPSNDLFEIVLVRLKKLDQNNSDTTGLVTNISNIPKKYQPKYFETLWNILTDTNSKSLKHRTIACCSSSKLHSNQVALVFKSDFLRRHVWNFTSEFLIDNPANLTDKLELFFQHLIQYKEEHWNETYAKKNLSGFINVVARSYMISKTCDDAFIVQFFDRFKAIFRESEAFQEFATLALVQMKNKSIENCSKLVSDLIDHVVDKFSEVCLGLLVETTLVVFSWYVFEFTRLQFCYHLLKFKKSTNNAIVVLKYLPTTKPTISTVGGEEDRKEKEELEIYQQVMSTIQSFLEASIEVHLNSYYKSLK